MWSVSPCARHLLVMWCHGGCCPTYPSPKKTSLGLKCSSGDRFGRRVKLVGRRTHLRSPCVGGCRFSRPLEEVSCVSRVTHDYVFPNRPGAILAVPWGEAGGPARALRQGYCRRPPETRQRPGFPRSRRGQPAGRLSARAADRPTVTRERNIRRNGLPPHRPGLPWFALTPGRRIRLTVAALVCRASDGQTLPLPRRRAISAITRRATGPPDSCPGRARRPGGSDHVRCRRRQAS